MSSAARRAAGVGAPRAQVELAGGLLLPLAHLRGDERGEVVPALVHELGGPPDDGGAVLDGTPAPLLVGGVRAPDDAVDLLGGREVELLLGLAGEGVDRRVPPRGGAAGGGRRR